MTTAEQLKAEGWAEGRAEGKAEGKAGLLLRLLRLKYGEVPDTALARLAGASSEELDLLGERVLSAATLHEVFGDRA